MKRRHAMLLIVVAVVVIAAAVAAMVRRGFGAQDEPSAIESMTARAMRRWAVPADLKAVKNPVALNAAVIDEARAHFADHCAGCHGNDGKGGALGQQMYPKAPDMTQQRTQAMSDGELFAVIENGVRLTGMPAFGNGTAESAYGSWTLVHFIRHLPRLTAEEIEQMERLNPKTAAAWQQIQAEDAFLAAESPTPPVEHHH